MPLWIITMFHCLVITECATNHYPACAFRSALDLCQACGPCRLPQPIWDLEMARCIFHLMTVATEESQVGARATPLLDAHHVGHQTMMVPIRSSGAPASITPGLSCPREGVDQASKKTGLVASTCHLKNIKNTDPLFKVELETAMENQHISKTANQFWFSSLFVPAATIVSKVLPDFFAAKHAQNLSQVRPIQLTLQRIKQQIHLNGIWAKQLMCFGTPQKMEKFTEKRDNGYSNGDLAMKKLGLKTELYHVVPQIWCFINVYHHFHYYLPVGPTREGPVKENHLITLMGINLFKINIHGPWLPRMEQLETTLPPLLLYGQNYCPVPWHLANTAPLLLFKIEILCHNLVQKSHLCYFKIKHTIWKTYFYFSIAILFTLTPEEYQSWMLIPLFKIMLVVCNLRKTCSLNVPPLQNWFGVPQPFYNIH